MNLDGQCKWESNQSYKEKFIKQTEQVSEKIEEKFEKLLELSTEEISPITKENALEETTANIGKYQRWLERLYRERQNLFKFKSKCDKIENELYHYFKFNSDLRDKLKSDASINRYINANDCCIAMKEVIRKQEAVIEFIQGTVHNMNSRNFAIKNIIEIWKAELGLGANY